MRRILFLIAIAAAVSFAADPAAPGIGKIFDGQIKMVERVVSLAEGMPADKYDFAPTGGESTVFETAAFDHSATPPQNTSLASEILSIIWRIETRRACKSRASSASLAAPVPNGSISAALLDVPNQLSHVGAYRR